jgi:DNA-binding NarL/FixJ family response regulator
MGLFDQAATLQEGRDERSALRCRWGAGECARKTDAREEAVVRLTEVESTATARGMTTLAARARRSLQQLGVPRPATPVRDGSGVLTARERDVLQAVAEGLPSGQIAARLGISRATVESHIRSAIRRLGVRTRIEAASVLRGEPGPAPARHAMTPSPATARRLAPRLRDDGWNVTDDFTPPNGGWSLADRRAACVATVTDERDLRDALLAAARGAVIIARIDTAHDVAAQLYEGLSRLGSVDVVHDGPGNDLTEDERRVLELLAAGAGRDQIANTLNLSRRTVDRRLARARTVMGARSTAEAVAAYLRHR